MVMAEEAWTPEGAETPDYTGVPIRKPKTLTRPKPDPISGLGGVGLNKAREHAASVAPRKVGVGDGTTAPIGVTDNPSGRQGAGGPAGNPWLAMPGAREKLDVRNKGEYEDPRFGEKFAITAARRGMDQMGPDNTANQYFQQYQNQIGQDPGLGAYYDRAKARTAATMNQQLASRGAYGNSVGIGLVGEAVAGLDAQRAKEEADYMLAQQDLGGLLAGQAGKSMMDWTGQLSDISLGGDRAAMERLSTGLVGATAADAGLLDRDRATWDKVFGATGMATGIIGSIQGNELMSDQQLFDTIMAMDLGYSAEELNQMLAQRVRAQENVNFGANVVGSFTGAGGGGG